MKISLFTPTHDTKFLNELYETILEQTYDNWEWVIMYNGDDTTKIGFSDPRVREVLFKGKLGNISTIKNMACQLCTGDILFEMDHDDLLMPSALQEVHDAFVDPEVGMVYSNTIHSSYDGTSLTRTQELSPDDKGIKWRDVTYKGVDLIEIISPSVNPTSITNVYYAPFHLRAYRRSLYEQLGGHDVSMEVMDDLDLTCRIYTRSKVVHIDKGLYVYRFHGSNAFINYTDLINSSYLDVYDKHIESVVEKWCTDNNLITAELGERDNAKSGCMTFYHKNSDVICDLNERWPFPDSSVGCIRAFDIFQKLRDPIFTMKELHRVLAPGGWALIQVPSTDGRGAFQDPSNVSYWNQNSFWFYISEYHAKYIDTPVRFQSIKLTTHENDDKVYWTTAHLVNLKDDYIPVGQVHI